MTTKYRVESIIGVDGERIVVVLEDGFPMWYPNLYYSTTRRANGYAHNTCLLEARNISKLHAWLAGNGIDLEQRFLQGDYLQLAEIDSLVDSIRRRCLKKPAACKTVKFQTQRRTLQQSPYISAKSANTAIHQIANYMDWWIDVSNGRVGENQRRAREVEIRRMLQALRKQAPRPDRADISRYIKALPDEVIDQIFTLIDPESDSNPWMHEGVRIRNYLAISMLYNLGIRKGELLGLKGTDLNLPDSCLQIRKTPDDPEDPRLQEPNAKTRARELMISGKLSQWINLYLRYRRRVKGTSKHRYLLVSHFGPNLGEPLSVVGFNKVIQDVKDALPPSEFQLSAHSFRHTFFTNYARHLKGLGMSPVEIKQRLDETGGWSPVHNTAGLYVRQFTIEEAQLAQQQHQETLGFPRIL